MKNFKTIWILSRQSTSRDIARVVNFQFSETLCLIHSGWLVGNRCGDSMEGKSFYNHNGKTLDADCYHRHSCQRQFTAATVVNDSEKSFHSECFKCKECDIVLSSSYVDRGSRKIYMKNCLFHLVLDAKSLYWHSMISFNRRGLKKLVY